MLFILGDISNLQGTSDYPHIGVILWGRASYNRFFCSNASLVTDPFVSVFAWFYCVVVSRFLLSLVLDLCYTKLNLY